MEYQKISDEKRNEDQPRGLRKTLITAVVLYILDALFFNQGVIALITLLIVVIVLLPKAFLSFKNKPLFKYKLLKAAVYFIMAVAVIGSNQINNKIAKYRAEKLIEACNQYHRTYNRYPDRLDDLIPDFIPKVPSAKLTFGFNKFKYISSDKHHSLMYVSFPPFGRPYYNFEKGKWGYLD